MSTYQPFGESRRTLIGCVLAVGAGMILPLSAAQTQTPDSIDTEGMPALERLPAGFEAGFFRNPNGSANFGSAQPPQAYVQVAAAILRGAPIDCRPIDVAYYLESVRDGKMPHQVAETIRQIAEALNDPAAGLPAFSRFYAYDWERNDYYNPLVIALFRGNGLKPYSGDQTPWCAAFVNWCISRSRVTNTSQIAFDNETRTKGSGSASSGSFRCWGVSTSEPKEGDIVVWAQQGSVTGRCPTTGPGHVAFLVGEVGGGKAKKYVVVGGNQGFKSRPDTANAAVTSADVAQAVSRRTIGARFGDRSLQSIRTADFLR